MIQRILVAAGCDKDSMRGQRSYLRAVRAVGALGAVACAAEEAEAEAYAQAFDALLLPGGADLPASYFGQEPHPACSYDDPARDLSDRLLMQAFRAAGKRILGICRGCQVANVYLGGTLHQHLPDAFDPVLWHSGNITGRHPATILEGTLLASLLGAGATAVNSSHHQAIDKPGEGLTIAARASDGVIEAGEGKDVLLLQWHPEQMGETMLPVFEWLCGKR